MTINSYAYPPFRKYVGRTIERIVQGKDSWGRDGVRIDFTDGSRVEVRNHLLTMPDEPKDAVALYQRPSGAIL